MGNVTNLVGDTGEGSQTGRYRWYETFSDYRVMDTKTGETRHMGDGVGMFGEDPSEGNDALAPGTRRFYDALNDYFAHEQAEIAEAYFGIGIKEERHGS